jgi:hypothetical protein
MLFKQKIVHVCYILKKLVYGRPDLGKNIVTSRICFRYNGRQALGEETLDEMRKTKTMRQRKIVMKELGFFPSQRALFITKLSWASAN